MGQLVLSSRDVVEGEPGDVEEGEDEDDGDVAAGDEGDEAQDEQRPETLVTRVHLIFLKTTEIMGIKFK